MAITFRSYRDAETWRAGIHALHPNWRITIEAGRDGPRLHCTAYGHEAWLDDWRDSSLCAVTHTLEEPHRCR
jgi:hypothetical protein